MTLDNKENNFSSSFPLNDVGFYNKVIGVPDLSNSRKYSTLASLRRELLVKENIKQSLEKDVNIYLPYINNSLQKSIFYYLPHS
jgi:hypothetical protein